MKKYKRVLAGIIATAIIMASALALTGCGSNATGTWYPIKDNPKTSIGSIELHSDGTATTDGLPGEWKEDGDNVYIAIMGVGLNFKLTEYKGYKVLCRDGRNFPEYCNSAEGAEQIYHGE